MKYQALRPHFFSMCGWLEGFWGEWWWGSGGEVGGGGRWVMRWGWWVGGGGGGVNGGGLGVGWMEEEGGWLGCVVCW